MMQTKSDGISIVIAVGVSLFISSLVVGTMISIGRSFDQEVALGRSLQFYYASEGALESALFHKSARGKGTHLPGLTTNAQNRQKMTLDGSLESSWSIESRANKLVGMIKEQTPLEINLYHPIDQDIDQTPSSSITELGSTHDFNLTLYEDSANMPADIKALFEDQFGAINIKDFPFRTSGADEPYIDWSAKRLGSNGYELFRTSVSDEGFVCHENVEATEITFRGCKSQILDPISDIHVLNSIDTGTGTHQEPALGAFTEGVAFNDFLDLGNNSYSHRSLTIAPLGSFVKDPANTSAPAKIPGIPYALTLNDDLITAEVFPGQTFTITTQVREGTSFALQNQIEIPEGTSNTDFNYVMFD